MAHGRGSLGCHAQPFPGHPLSLGHRWDGGWGLRFWGLVEALGVQGLGFSGLRRLVFRVYRF